MWLVDFVIIVTVLEGAMLVLWHRRTGCRPAPGQVLPNLAAGLFLLLAVRVALGGGGIGRIAVCLAGAGCAHVLDLRSR